MKKLMFFFVAAFFLSVGINSFAQDLSEDEIAQRVEILTNSNIYFPRLLHKDVCDIHIPEEIYTRTNGDTVVTWQKDGVYSVTIKNSTPVEEEHSAASIYIPLEKGSYENFHVHLDMKIVNGNPQGVGACFLQYSDREILGYDNSHAINLIIGEGIDGYVNSIYGKKEFVILDLSDTYNEIGKMYQTDIIRINGMTYFYIDGKFVAEYEDKFNSRFTWTAGTILNAGGKEATCAFDNFFIFRQ